MSKKYLLMGSIFPTVIALDQWTKYLIYSQFRWGESIPVIKHFFNITYVRNTGAAFGLFHEAPPVFRDPFFIIVPIVAMIIIAVLFWRLSEEQKWVACALSLILGGAVGNLIDRVRFGYVVDFLDFHWKAAYHWPAFQCSRLLHCGRGGHDVYRLLFSSV